MEGSLKVEDLREAMEFAVETTNWREKIQFNFFFFLFFLTVKIVKLFCLD